MSLHVFRDDSPVEERIRRLTSTMWSRQAAVA
jgi:hypothetical protein